ncbi:MAG: YraN family protein [Epulopiscium sp. Nele67-Bin004]|nr:MAG: YraN family protein [Epulopiscium sp. Nele67-Bin004]
MNYTQGQNGSRGVGTKYENLAVKYLEDLGYTIVTKNYRNKTGEIDIIARDNNYLVFVEVKYRQSSAFGHPREAVNYSKRKNIIKVAKYYLYTHKLDVYCRFDVVEVCDDKINHLPNAFWEG